MSRAVDLYALLGVAPTADAAAIRAAHRRLIKQHHPDAGGDPARAAELNRARDTLLDPDARAAYDARRAAPKRAAPKRPAPKPASPARAEAVRARREEVRDRQRRRAEAKRARRAARIEELRDRKKAKQRFR